ncbi:hypothetical protein M0722_04610 [Microbacterium sp. KSW4-16]|uniref:hypothetical protein n=1 Tax=Microbacterium TaxID=33882 RepID=UPI0011BAEEC2|nr:MULTISPECIES: hypothetical protein [Microbacterium]MCK8466463.1 hypothetical protein [Microbacterium aurugineum]QEA29099.1 hypothetical protein FGL91_11335 [Microbacterium sp. CBA3102]
MDEPQPELRWAPLPPQPKKTGKVWLIVGLVVAALAIVGALLFFFLPRGDAPAPTDSASPSPSATSTPTATPTPTSSPTPEPVQTPQVTAPPVADPSIEVFRERVSGWLGDAPRGLDIIAGASGQDALPVLDTLQQDAQRLSDALPPSSIEQQWREGVSTYATRLSQLRSAITDGSGVAAAVEAARSSVQQLRSLAGL